jgi:hypothetical protein
MGVASWIVSGLTAFVIARIIPSGRSQRSAGDLLVSLSAALLLGGIATALDFGGRNELEWRAALLAFFGALAAGGLLRVVVLLDRTSGRSGSEEGQ